MLLRDVATVFYYINFKIVTFINGALCYMHRSHETPKILPRHSVLYLLTCGVVR